MKNPLNDEAFRASSQTEAVRTDTFREVALSKADTAAAVGGQVEHKKEGPFFLDNAGPNVDIPTLITRANARELLGKKPGESVTEALTRQTSRDR